MAMPYLPASMYSNAVMKPQALNIPPIDGTYWGTLVSTMLLGVTMSQVWMYANYNRDSWGLRGFVALLILIDFAITGVTWQVLHFYLMINFGNPLVFLTVPGPWAAATILTKIVATAADGFFATRIYLLNKHCLWPSILVCIFATGGLVCIIVAVVKIVLHYSISQLATSYEKRLVGMSLGFHLCTMVFITGVLVTRLSSTHRSVARTKTTTQRLLLFFVTRGLLVMLNDLIFLVLFEMNDSGASVHPWVPFLLLTPKLHIITMMAILNSRQSSAASQPAAGVVTSFADGSYSPINFKWGNLTVRSGTGFRSTAVPPPTHIFSLMDRSERYGNVSGMGARRTARYSDVRDNPVISNQRTEHLM